MSQMCTFTPSLRPLSHALFSPLTPLHDATNTLLVTIVNLITLITLITLIKFPIHHPTHTHTHTYLPSFHLPPPSRGVKGRRMSLDKENVGVFEVVGVDGVLEVIKSP